MVQLSPEIAKAICQKQWDAIAPLLPKRSCTQLPKSVYGILIVAFDEQGHIAGHSITGLVCKDHLIEGIAVVTGLILNAEGKKVKINGTKESI